MDTDWDGLCDAWEVYFIGTNAVSSITSNPYIFHYPFDLGQCDGGCAETDHFGYL